MSTDEYEYYHIYTLLRHHEYPPGFSKSEKRGLRRKATTNYKVERGLLFYRRKGGNAQEWKQVPRSTEETRRILEVCHALPEGMVPLMLCYEFIIHSPQSTSFKFVKTYVCIEHSLLHSNSSFIIGVIMMVSLSQSQEVFWDVIRHITNLQRDFIGSLYGEMSRITV